MPTYPSFTTFHLTIPSSGSPTHTVEVIGKQWSWDFNYVDEGVYETGVQAALDGTEGAEERLPTLVLPVDEKVEFVLYARDVNHSFWIPAFYYKLDVIPGRLNSFDATPNKIGVYDGKCAELCGTYHARMLFTVHVVSKADYETYMKGLAARGQTGVAKGPAIPDPQGEAAKNQLQEAGTR